MRRNGKLFAGDYINGIKSIAGYDGFLMHRLPYPTLWSLYHHVRYRKGIYNGTFTQFIKNRIIGVEPYLVFYDTWYTEFNNMDHNYTMIYYESMPKYAAIYLRQILKKAGVKKIISKNINKAVKFCKFKNLQALEMKGFFHGRRAGTTKGKKGLKFRQGGVVEKIRAANLICDEIEAVKARRSNIGL
jgi:hypothetical protein